MLEDKMLKDFAQLHVAATLHAALYAEVKRLHAEAELPPQEMKAAMMEALNGGMAMINVLIDSATQPRIVARNVSREEFLKAAEERAELNPLNHNTNPLRPPKSINQMKSEAGTMTHPGGKLPVDCPAMAASVCAASGLLGALQNTPIYEVAIDPAVVPNGDQSVMRIVGNVPQHAGEVSVKLNRHPAPQGINKVR